MEKRVIIVCIIVAFLGIVSAALSFIAEVKRIKATQIQLDTTSQCIFPRSPAFVLATAAVVFLAIAHIVINVATGCLCVRILPEVLNFRLTTALVSSTMSWFTLSAAVFLLISGAALSYKDGEESTYEGNYYCFVINRRIFALGGLLSLATVFLGILAHILVFSADDLDERWAPPAAPGLHGIAMGQAELSPQSSGDQEFVQEIIAYRGQEMV